MMNPLHDKTIDSTYLISISLTDLPLSSVDEIRVLVKMSGLSSL